MTETAKTAEKLKKGEGPIVTLFLDKDGKEVTRPSVDGGTVITFKDRVGGVVTIDLNAIPDNARNVLLARAVKASVEGLVRTTGDAHGKDKDGKNIVVPTAKVAIDRILKGEIYVRGTGAEKGPKGPKGRPFDVMLWVDGMRDAMKMKTDSGKLRKLEDGSEVPFQYATQEQLDNLKTKLESSTPADRKKITDKFMTDKTIAFCVGKIKLSRLAEAAKKDLEDGGEEISL